MREMMVVPNRCRAGVMYLRLILTEDMPAECGNGSQIDLWLARSNLGIGMGTRVRRGMVMVMRLTCPRYCLKPSTV
jgi:hypothetical protein